jgi:ribosomal protein L32
MGLFMELQHLTDTPTVKCSKCGATANLPHNVCFPATLET